MVVEERDGRRCIDFEVGDRSEETLCRLYERWPEAGSYHSDAYPVYRAGGLRGSPWWARGAR